MAAPDDVVLVVDDDRMNRKLAQAWLIAYGYAVELAESGEVALERFAAMPNISLVLLDISMGGIDGFETCRRLRGLPRGADVPIVFLTAHSGLGQHEAALESGADDYLTKPIDQTELLLRVRSLLRISRMNRELRESHAIIEGQRDELVKAQRRKDDLVSFVVHDLKTPLTSIFANVDSVLTAPISPEDTAEVLRDVQQASEDLLRLIMNLLDIGRSEDGELALARTETDLARLAERSIAAMRSRLEARNLAIVTDLPSMPAAVDEELIRRMIDNLLDNCIKHAPRGTAIALRGEGGEAAGGVHVLRISDEGHGIPPEQRERIFDKYVQLDAGLSGVRTGRGLGLTFCRLVVEAHGGTITVEPGDPRKSGFSGREDSQTGFSPGARRGSTFVVRLPAARG